MFFKDLCRINFIAETGQPKQPLDRGFLAEELNVEEDKNCSQV
jgi:hypothetical protein